MLRVCQSMLWTKNRWDNYWPQPYLVMIVDAMVHTYVGVGHGRVVQFPSIDVGKAHQLVLES